MKLKLILPVIRTYNSSYHTTEKSLSIKLGYISNHTNVADRFYSVTVYLKDTFTDQIISTEVLKVALNSFETEYTVIGLQSDKLYAFMIDSGFQQVTTTIISTMIDISRIKIIGRDHIFSQNVRLYGDSIELLDDMTIDLRKSNGIFTLVEFGSVIIDNGDVFTFCPISIITTRHDYPNIITYRPLIGLEIRQIMIHIIPVIQRLSNTLFSIRPATVIRIINHTSKIDHITSEAVTMIDLSIYGITSMKSFIIPIYK